MGGRGWTRLTAAATAGYALGTVPSADVAARLASGGTKDLRAAGSGNPGAYNAIKVLGPGWGYGVMAADIGKGALACSVGRRLAGSGGANLAGTAAVVGHCFPVWNGFRGGKGVAASVGQCAATFPVYVPIDLGVAWITGTRRFRRRAYAATVIGSIGWVAASVLWWRRRWSNAWGPEPTVALPLASAASSAVIIGKFMAAARKEGGRTVIGYCVDSNAQMPPELIERYGVEVVPLTVVIDGEALLEGVTIDADGFYDRFAAGPPPEVSTAAPAPGQFVQAYEKLAAAGADEILSVHIGSALSGTVNAATVGAAASPVPVRIVDTGTVSFAIACCLWEAAEAVARGATLEEAAAVAESVGATVTSVFVVQALDLARAGGRLSDGVGATGGVPVLTMADGKIIAVGQATSSEDAADQMASYICRAGTGLRVGISIADAGAAPLWQALEARLSSAPEVVDLVRYRVGPSVGVHTGPGTAGAMAYPAMTG